MEGTKKEFTAPVRRFDFIQSEIEDLMLRLNLSLSDRHEKKIWDQLTDALDTATSTAIQARDFVNDRN